jgi:hypothetical protein
MELAYSHLSHSQLPLADLRYRLTSSRRKNVPHSGNPMLFNVINTKMQNVQSTSIDHILSLIGSKDRNRISYNDQLPLRAGFA